MNCDQARLIDIVDFLGRLNCMPARHPKPNIYWFHSPLHSDRTPSFKVDSTANEWYDFGLGLGGSIIDLGIKLFDCSVSEFLGRLQAGVYGNDLVVLPEIKPRSAEPGIEIVSVRPLTHPALYNYLLDRAISLPIARSYLKEVVFRIDKKEQFALGFPNRSGGYELRNKFFKGSAAPKDIFLETHGAPELVVFEGFMDFLSFLSNKGHLPKELPDFLIANSITANFVKVQQVISQYPKSRLFFDDDDTGRAFTNTLLELPDNKGKISNDAGLYVGFKDYNAWWVHQCERVRIRYPPKAFRLPG